MSYCYCIFVTTFVLIYACSSKPVVWLMFFVTHYCAKTNNDNAYMVEMAMMVSHNDRDQDTICGNYRSTIMRLQCCNFYGIKGLVDNLHRDNDYLWLCQTRRNNNDFNWATISLRKQTGKIVHWLPCHMIWSGSDFPGIETYWSQPSSTNTNPSFNMTLDVLLNGNYPLFDPSKVCPTLTTERKI